MQQDRSSGCEDDVPPAGAEPHPRLRLVRGFANRRHPKGVPRLLKGAAENVFRTEVAICELTVTGVLPGAVGPHGGTIAIGGDVHGLSCDEALELVDALLLVVTRMDVVAEERHSATTDTPRDRED
jgi:hypothetical protein